MLIQSQSSAFMTRVISSTGPAPTPVYDPGHKTSRLPSLSLHPAHAHLETWLRSRTADSISIPGATHRPIPEIPSPCPSGPSPSPHASSGSEPNPRDLSQIVRDLSQVTSGSEPNSSGSEPRAPHPSPLMIKLSERPHEQLGTCVRTTTTATLVVFP